MTAGVVFFAVLAALVAVWGFATPPRRRGHADVEWPRFGRVPSNYEE